MKPLRDFFRLRTDGRYILAGCLEAVRASLTVTAVQPLNGSTNRVPIDMHRHIEFCQGRLPSHGHEHLVHRTRTSRHLHLVSSN